MEMKEPEGGEEFVIEINDCCAAKIMCSNYLEGGGQNENKRSNA